MTTSNDLAQEVRDIRLAASRREVPWTWFISAQAGIAAVMISGLALGWSMYARVDDRISAVATEAGRNGTRVDAQAQRADAQDQRIYELKSDVFGQLSEINAKLDDMRTGQMIRDSIPSPRRYSPRRRKKSAAQ